MLRVHSLGSLRSVTGLGSVGSLRVACVRQWCEMLSNFGLSQTASFHYTIFGKIVYA